MFGLCHSMVLFVMEKWAFSNKGRWFGVGGDGSRFWGVVYSGVGLCLGGAAGAAVGEPGEGAA